MWLPDPRFEAPELFDPGRKPVSNVVIDWDNNLIRNMTDGGLFTFRCGIALMSDGKYHRFSKRLDADLFTATLEKNAAKFTGANEAIYYNTSAVNRFRVAGVGNAQTIITLFTPRSNGEGGFGRLWEENNNGRGALYLRSSSPRMRMGTSGVDGNLSSWVPDFGKTYLVYCKKGSGNWSIGIGEVGKRIIDTATATATSDTSSILYIGTRSSLDRTFDGDIHYLINDYREWPDAHIVSLLSDPYQFLMPA